MRVHDFFIHIEISKKVEECTDLSRRLKLRIKLNIRWRLEVNHVLRNSVLPRGWEAASAVAVRCIGLSLLKKLGA